MATFTRNNAWNNGGTFANDDLLWYAKGVGEMQALNLDNPNSWWFFAAIHGEYVSLTSFPGWGSLPSPPAVPTKSAPSSKVQGLYWDQCQHQSWYFPPWHRGYLIALEGQIRQHVVKLDGPDTWALPYWNYFGLANQFKIPPAFLDATLPDGSPNPLLVKARYGPTGNGSIFVRVPPVSQACMTNTIYTGSNASTPRPGFGGPVTGFSHDGQRSGNLEQNPHNLVHGEVGGPSPTNPQEYGLMADPGIAALDPIFYLHHSNIDRLWAIWNADGNDNPTDPAWLQGPAAAGGREFIMPMPSGTPWVFTPEDVDSLSKVDYDYEEMTTTVASVSASTMLSRRLTRLGAAPAPDAQLTAAEGGDVASEQETELVGANDGPMQVSTSGVRTRIDLAPDVRSEVVTRLADASVETPPDRIYLQLENVTGTLDAHQLNVYVGEQLAGTVGLFGLRRASLRDGHRGGQGLDFDLDITSIVDSMYVDHGFDIDALDVTIRPSTVVPEGSEFNVGRVGIYREGHS